MTNVMIITHHFELTLKHKNCIAYIKMVFFPLLLKCIALESSLFSAMIYFSLPAFFARKWETEDSLNLDKKKLEIKIFPRK